MQLYFRSRTVLRTTTVVQDNIWRGHALHVAVVAGKEWIAVRQRAHGGSLVSPAKTVFSCRQVRDQDRGCGG